MAKIDLFDPKWIDMVFANKNREYGAYKLRKGTSGRNLLALAILMSAALLIGGYLAWKVIEEQRAKELEEYNAQLELSKLQEQQKKERQQEEQKPPPPQEQQQQVPEERATQKFTAPEIKKEINEENQLKSLDELDKNTAVGAETKEGTEDRIVPPTAVEVPKEEPKVEEAPPPPPPVDNKVYDVVEQQPSFPGGQGALMAWLAKNIQYPPIAQENGIFGTVVVSFVVEKDGSVTDVKVVRGKDASLDKEAIRAVSHMPKWIPGKQNGQSVRVKYTLPVKFQLQ